MIRHVIAGIGALVVALSLAPPAAAIEGEGGQTVVSLGGQIRCLFSPNDVPRGGGSMAVCQLANGQPLAAAPWSVGKYPQRMDVAVLHDNGQWYWAKGGISPANEISIGEGQTAHAYGWTIEDQGLRIRITNDYSKRVMLVNTVEVRQI